MTLLSDSIPWNNPMTASPDKEEAKKYLLLYPHKKDDSCPLEVSTRTILHLLSQGEIEKALLTMKEQNPFPIICGHLCHCEKDVLPNSPNVILEEIKKQLALYENSGKFLPPPPYPVLHTKNIAVLGASLAGLTIALDLCRLGYKVNVFEKGKKACPSLYDCLPVECHKILEKEIIFIQERGVKIFLDRETPSLDFLLTEYSVVVLATQKDSIPVQSDKKNIFSIGEISSQDTIAQCIQKGHELAVQIAHFLQNQNPVSGKQSLLPILRHYQAACPYHATQSEASHSKEEIVSLASSVKCLYCGLWKREGEFTQEGCLNCTECEHCLASCGYKQVFVTTEQECFLAKTTESIASELYAGKEKSLYSNGKKVCTLHSIVPEIAEQSCVSCGRCEEVCPYHAVRVVYRKGKAPVAEIDPKACRGCTLCVSACPNNAIEHFLFSPEKFKSKKLVESKTAFLACRWSDAFENFQNSIFSLMCTRYATPKILLLALWHGAEQIKIHSCTQDHCHYLGNSNISQKIHKCQELLFEIGLPTKIISQIQQNFSESERNIPQPLPRPTQIPEGKADLPEAFIAMQGFETFAAKPEPVQEQSALILGASNLLEKLLESEEILPRGTFVESIRILLHSASKPVALLPGISSLDIPWEESNLHKKALENLSQYTQNSSIKEMILAYPELYPNMLPSLIPLVPLPLVLQKKLAFKTCNLTVALHKPCYHKQYAQSLLLKSRPGETPGKSLEPAQVEQEFFTHAMALLQEVPGIKVIPIMDSCGHAFFRTQDHSQREVSYNLLRQAQQSKADLLLTVSPYCANQIAFTLRKGAWQEIYMESKDIYSFLVDHLA